jgi:hypothetical protein
VPVNRSFPPLKNLGTFCALASSARLEVNVGDGAMTTPEMIIVWAILGLIGFVVALR